MSEQNLSLAARDDLIRRALELAKSSAERIYPAASEERLASYLENMRADAGRGQSIIPASQTAVELGSPQCISENGVLWTFAKNLVTDARIHLLGPDLPECGGRSLDFCQLILLGLVGNTPPEKFKLEAGQFLPDRLPGLMARMIPGRLWIRISLNAISAGLDFQLVGAALAKAYKAIGGVQSVEIILVTDKAAAEKFHPMVSEVRILAGTHKRVALGAGGDYECRELNCERCEDKPICDIIREVKVIRRRGQKAAKA
jgi:hypothetical protein